jgi:hypothetical protein
MLILEISIFVENITQVKNSWSDNENDQQGKDIRPLRQ